MKVVASAFVLLAVVVIGTASLQALQVGEHFTSTDLYNYWILAQQFYVLENPYDFEKVLLVAEHNKIGPGYFAPWTFIFFAPLLAHSYSLVVPLYLFACAFAVLVLANLSHPVMRFDRPPSFRTIALSFITFAPIYILFSFGQMSIFFALIAYGAVAAYRSKQDSLAGGLIALASIKPHISFLLWIYLCVSALKVGRWRVLVSAVLCLALLLLLTEIWFPGITRIWVQTEKDPLRWLAASLMTPLRLLLANTEHSYPPQLAIALPILASVLVAVLAWNRPLDQAANHVPALLVASLLLSPYLWPCDYVVLFALHISFFSQSSRSWAIVTAVFINLMFFYQSMSDNTLVEISVYWYPIAVYCLWYWVTQSKSEQSLRKRNFST
jgi:hypothetical protein